MCDEYDGMMSISSVSFFSQQGAGVIKMIASYSSPLFFLFIFWIKVKFVEEWNVSENILITSKM